ncbi:MAG: hypothetical protein EOO43_09745 [Flavobacterium sp.]|nr:MAG: hypothetical protein EOO43_09745 [Flavobacterium sp.]
MNTEAKTTNASDLDDFIRESDKSLQLARENGITVDMSKWLTLKRYAQKYSIASTNVLSNWISRGIIAAENVMDLPELNDLRLIRDIPYRDAQ